MKNQKKLIENIISVMGVSLLSLMIFHVVTGGLANVLSDGMMVDGDYPNAAAGFHVFVNDQWRFPLGSNPAFGGTNILFSDPSTVYALFAKVVKTLTGVTLDFNYLIVSNFLLFGLFSLRLAKRLTVDHLTQGLIVIFLLFNLIMPSRIIGGQHMALGAYWVVIWSMTSVGPGLTHRKIGFYEPFFCVTVAILSHSYLGAMAIAVVMIQLILKKRYVSTILTPVFPALALGVLGFFSENYVLSHVAKSYGLNLGAYFYSLNWAMTGDWYAVKMISQNDIYLYLGSGVLLLLFANIFGYSFKSFFDHGRSINGSWENKEFLFGLIISSVLLVLYAAAFEINFFNYKLANFEIPSMLEFLYGRFRIAGRFGTVFCYVFTIFIVLLWCQIKNKNAIWWVVSAFAIFMQIADSFHAAKHASHKSAVAIEDKNHQSRTVAKMFENITWSGRVMKNVNFEDLESQRLLDYLLLQHGAKEFSAVHSARADAVKVKKLMEAQAPQAGDLLITRTAGNSEAKCVKISRIKEYDLCLVRQG